MDCGRGGRLREHSSLFAWHPRRRPRVFFYFPAALTQMFFSLSLGMGVLITYGSYTDKKTNLLKSALTVPLFDTLAALLAALAIMPAVFALGYGPWSGVQLPTLTGQRLPLLDWVDYVGEYVMLTLGSLALCVMVGHLAGPEALEKEIEQHGVVFRRKRLWRFMLRYVTPVLIAITFLCATGVIRV